MMSFSALANLLSLTDPSMRHFKERIEHHQLTKIMELFAPIVIIINPLYAGFVAWGIWKPEIANELIYWLVAFVILSIYWSFLLSRYRCGLSKQYFSQFAFSFFIAGTLWGSVATFHMDLSSTDSALFISLMLLAINVAPIVSISVIPRIYFSCMVSSLSQLVWVGFQQQVEGLYWYPLLIILIMVGYSIFALVLFKSGYRSLALQFINEELIEALKQEKLIAERASAAKTRFLASASHDLRQPLQAQEIYIDILKSRSSLAKDKEIINQLQLTSLSLNELLTGLLDISKLDAGITEPNFQSVRINDLFKRIYSEQSVSASAKGLKLKILYSDAVIKTDPILFYSLLSNLVSNAVKYTQSGWVLLACRLSANNHFDIEIRDSGLGIPQSERDKVFEEFYQLENSERDRRKGLGLGLSIVKRLAKLLNSSVELVKGRQRGSHFIITTSKGDDQLITNADEYFEDFERPLNILIIDDDQLVLDAIASIVTEWGHATVTAHAFNDAIIEVEAFGSLPDIILCDLRLADNISGIDVIHQLKVHFGDDIPSIIITGDTSPQRVKLLAESGIPFLHKPVKLAQLRSVIIANSFSNE